MIQLKIIKSTSSLSLGSYCYYLDSISIGKDLKNHIIINDPSLYSVHCLLKLSPDNLIFKSDYTYFLNSKKTAGTIKIKKQDQIKIGNTIIKIEDFDLSKAISPDHYFEFLKKIKQENPSLHNLFLALENEYIYQMEEAHVMEK